MKLKQHIEFGKYIMNDLGMTDYINRKAYLFGNIAPDLNCVYPAHRLSTTENRFYKRLNIIERSNIKVIKSFYLGVITHYICDYFCYAHNIESLGILHKRYENELYNYYTTHQKELEEQFKKKYTCDNEVYDKINRHSELIISHIKNINKTYTNNMIKHDNKYWANNTSQMQSDLEYAMSVAEYITSLLLNNFSSNKACIQNL